jgi:nucleotide-binding universal stress UspA family protein
MGVTTDGGWNAAGVQALRAKQQDLATDREHEGRTTMSGTIICGVDEKATAREAFDVALDLSQRLDARLLMVHVAAGELDPRETELLLAEIAVEAGMERHTERRVAFGDAVEELASLADEERADLLVVGAGWRGASSAVRLGSVSTILSRRAPCPVVIVPPGVGLRSRLAVSRKRAGFCT